MPRHEHDGSAITEASNWREAGVFGAGGHAIPGDARALEDALVDDEATPAPGYAGKNRDAVPTAMAAHHRRRSRSSTRITLLLCGFGCDDKADPSSAVKASGAAGDAIFLRGHPRQRVR